MRGSPSCCLCSDRFVGLVGLLFGVFWTGAGEGTLVRMRCLQVCHLIIYNSFGETYLNVCLGKHQKLLVVSAHMVKVWRNGSSGGRIFTLLWATVWGFDAGKGDSPSRDALLRPAVGCFCRQNWFGSGTGRPPSPSPPPRPPEAFLPSLAPSAAVPEVL